MKILALTTCNDNYQYYRWIPHAVRFWQKLGFDFVVHFYADEIPEKLLDWREYIVLEKPPKNMTISSVCQISRLFLPVLHTNYDLIVITDVDLLPLSNSYFDMVRSFPKDKFVAMRQKENDFYMGFNCASTYGWQKLTNVTADRKHINQVLYSIFKQNKVSSLKEMIRFSPIKVDWGLDQKLLTRYLDSMDEKDKLCITGLKEVYSLHSGFTIKLAYFKSSDLTVEHNWIRNNKEKIAFYTRDDSRELDSFDNEIEFLEDVYGI